MRRWETSLMMAALFMAAATHQSLAAEPEIGTPAPQFELTDSSGQVHKLSDYKGKLVVIHFQSCVCPWDQAYQPILNRLAKLGPTGGPGEVGDRMVFLAINSNRSEDVDQIGAYVKAASIAYPILKDPVNEVADAYAAQTTPHIFVIGDDDEQTLLYKGGIEKAPLSPQDCGFSDEQYLEPVLGALLKGEAPPQSETQSVGCSIKRQAG